MRFQASVNSLAIDLRFSIKWKYRVLASLFAVMMLYLLGSAIGCILQASKRGGNTYRIMLFSMVITYGSWVASSLLALDPWHLLSSMFQYLLLVPFYINLLNMCAYQADKMDHPLVLITVALSAMHSPIWTT